MKKRIMMWCVAIACLVACTDSDDLQNNIVAGEEQYVITSDMLSDVPIKFAPINRHDIMVEEESEVSSLTRGTTSNVVMDNLGVFCLAKYALEGSEYPTPSWSMAKNNAYYTNCVWNNNVRANISSTTQGGRTSLVLTCENQDSLHHIGYYPSNNWFAYGFVAYHPRTENIVYGYSLIKGYIKIDGKDKVLYSMAKKPKAAFDDENLNRSAFSKYYYENVDAELGLEEYIYPYFDFETLTSTLYFYISSKSVPCTNLHVEKIEFDDFPCIMVLGLANLLRYADKVSYDMKSTIAKKPFVLNKEQFDELELSQFPELTSPFGHFELYDTDGTSISGKKNADGSYKYTVSTERMKVGGGLYIPPVYKDHSRASMKVYVTLADDYGNKYKSVNPVAVNIPEKGWEKNKYYEIGLSLTNPAEAAKDASLAEWVAADPIEIDATNTTWEELP